MAHKRIRPLRSFLIRIGMKILFFLGRVFPTSLVYAFGAGLGELFYLLARKNRRIALANARLALGNEVAPARLRTIVRQSCRTIGRAVVDVPRFMHMPAKQMRHLVSLTGVEHLEKALQAGKGVIGISAHLGSFLLVGSRLRAEEYRVHYIARHMRDRSVEQISLQVARQTKIQIIFNRPAVACFRQCVAALTRNEIVIIEVDQNFGSEGVTIPFFNRPAVMATGPLVLAQRTSAVMLPMFVINETGFRYRVVIEPAIEVASGKDGEQRFVERIIMLMERYIRQRPGQWISWMHTPWRTEA